ncbi:MAG TPA: hypothetical protein VF614_01530 [Chthoniobacteraceae bacterium]|jgi:hypothetical protein
MNYLAKIGAAMFALVIAFSMMSQCGRQSEPQAARAPQPAQPAEITLREFSKGLDLDAVTLLAKKAKDAPDFERLLNSQAEAVNNIDLNEDSKVDYIKVSEYGSGDQRGFSLTTELAPGQVQEIATIAFKREPNGATVQTAGNPSLYGPGSYHHSSFGLTDALLVGWLFSNRPSYSSPYGNGNYPSSYGRGWDRRDYDRYRGDMSSRTANSTIRRSSQPVLSPVTSPNADKVAAKARALANPTRSQRSFAPANPSANRPATSSPPRSGGFGRSTSSGPSRSGGSFGGGK